MATSPAHPSRKSQRPRSLQRRPQRPSLRASHSQCRCMTSLRRSTCSCRSLSQTRHRRPFHDDLHGRDVWRSRHLEHRDSSRPRRQRLRTSVRDCGAYNGNGGVGTNPGAPAQRNRRLAVCTVRRCHNRVRPRRAASTVLPESEPDHHHRQLVLRPDNRRGRLQQVDLHLHARRRGSCSRPLLIARTWDILTERLVAAGVTDTSQTLS